MLLFEEVFGYKAKVSEKIRQFTYLLVSCRFNSIWIYRISEFSKCRTLKNCQIRKKIFELGFFSMNSLQKCSKGSKLWLKKIVCMTNL